MTPSPLVSLDPQDPTPPNEQVRRQILASISAGRLVPGSRLPPVRALATELGLAAGTVARAYRELEQVGVVRTQGRAGTTVTASGDAVLEEGARLAADYASGIRALGITPKDALALVSAALAAG